MNRPLPSYSHGYSLIEVLVTLLLTSIGILGMAAMQTKAISYTQDSVHRNTAAMLADELMEVMRADTDKVLTAASLPRESSDYYSDGLTAAQAPCTNLPADPEDRLACWAARVVQVLPGSADLLSSEFHIKPVDATIEIQLGWRVPAGACLDEGGNAESTVCHYRLRTEL